MITKSIYGPPGTGKTTHVLGMIKDMVDSGEDARGISFLSFTRAAANEALKRMGMKKSDNVCTLHALCYRLLKLSPQMVMDTAKMGVLCDDAGFSMGMDSYDKTEYDFYLSMSQYARNAMVDLDEAYSVCGGHGSLAELYSFHDTYTKWKEAYGVVDFDDMVHNVVKNRLYPKVKHIIIDEAQDLTPLQWAAIDAFSVVRGVSTVTIAGDDDQCQPAGAMVLTPNGEVPIETLRNGDMVVSYDRQHSAFKPVPVRVASRPYEGKVVVVVVGGKISAYTPDHKCLVRYAWSSEHFECLAGNVIGGLHLMAVSDGVSLTWLPVSVKRKEYFGEVYSLGVGGTETYIADGVYTHNCLYKFSGADPSGMRKFEERFDAERRILSVSWRVPRSVHAVAQGIIGRVSDRVPKEYSPRDEDGTVAMVSEFEPSDLKEDAPTMVLGRTNYVLRKFSQLLREEGIRYSWQNEGGAWKRDAGLSIRIWKKLQAGDDITTKEYNALSKVLTVDAKKAINSRKLDIFKKDWSEVMVLPPEAIEQIEIHGEDALVSVPSVELYTIHGAKGKECDNVILLTELTDRVRDGMDSDPDVEARVFYVGVTRAMTNLVVVGGYDGYPIY